MKAIVDVLLACAIVVVVTLVSERLQTPTPVVVWDAGQYYAMASRMAAGDRAYAESPYVFRVGVPWLVSRISPADPKRGFFLVNLASAFAIAVLLMIWLRTWGIARGVALTMIALFAVAWHGPARYIFYNPGYVDPFFIVLLLAGLLAIRWIVDRYAAGKVVLLTLVSGVGGLVRETMVLVPLAFLFVNAPVRAIVARRRAEWRVPAAALAAPFAACIAAIVWTHRIVAIDRMERSSMVDAAWQWLHKSPDAFAMGWLATFGPVLAVIAVDWRRALAFLGEHEWLAAFLAGCAALSFVGGSDTERFAFWALPAIYLLLSRAVEGHRVALASAPVAATLAIAQAVSARVFWGIPDPHGETVVALAGTLGWRASTYGFLNRLFVIDSFHYNLWSSFGSRPFRLLRLAVYFGVMTGLAWLIVLQDRKVALGTFWRAGHRPEHRGVVE